MRTLGALGLAERNGTLRTKVIESLNQGFVHHDWIGREVTVTFDVFGLAARVFSAVVEYDLIADFSRPSDPEQSEFVPVIPIAQTSPFLTLRGRYDPRLITTDFGQLIT